MMRFLADENFNNRILRGLQRERSEIDIVRVQDTDLYRADDLAVLEYATKTQRILLTHDLKTMPKYLYQRLSNGQTTASMILIATDAPIGLILSDLLLFIAISQPDDLLNQAIYLPL